MGVKEKISFLTRSVSIIDDRIYFNIRPSVLSYFGVIIWSLALLYIIDVETTPLIFKLLLFLMLIFVVLRAMYHQEFIVNLKANSVEINKRIEPLGMRLSKSRAHLYSSIFYLGKPLTKSNNTISWNIYVKGTEKNIIVFETLTKSDIEKIESLFEKKGFIILDESR